MPLSISVITPSYNQAEYLPAAIASVSAQSRPAIEHLVYDPGSTDSSRSIAAAAPGVTLIAEPDKGQADAVARGMRDSKGDIIAWLNSDDEYYDGEVFADVASAFERNPDADIVYGAGEYIDADGSLLRAAYVLDDPRTLPNRLAAEVGILQPAAFISRRLIERIGPVDPDLSFCMDYEFWIRAAKAGARFLRLDRNLAKARYYPDNKTLGSREESLLEVVRMLKKHYGFAHYRWMKRYADYKLHNHDGILAHFGSTAHDAGALDACAKHYTNRANGDYRTASFLRNCAEPALVGRTFAAAASGGMPIADQYSSPVDPSVERAPGARCYTVGDQRWAFEKRWLDSDLQRSTDHILDLAGRRRGDTCVIAGNGPSLNAVDFSQLADVDVFITNYAFMKKQLRAVARYLCVTNYLVAEQEAAAFNLIEDVEIIAPYWLSYCLLPSENTSFVRSVGHAAFSTDFTENVSWRSTVSFFAMQMAYALGYRKVLLVGFDHSYVQPQSAEGDLIRQTEDDPNHFDARYFKGKVWQAADTENMEAMYRLAKEAFERDGREIVNCTTGGALELFRRGALETELRAVTDDDRAASSFATGVSQFKTTESQTETAQLPDAAQADDLPFVEAAPRLLLIDHTRIGDGSATGEVKSAILEGWPAQRLAQIYAAPHNRFGYIENREETRFSIGPDGMVPDEIRSSVERFDPELILYRPAPAESALALHVAAMEFIYALGAPVIVWIMDDWPALIDVEASDSNAIIAADWKSLTQFAARRLSIGAHMSEAFGKRYNAPFEPFANAVDPDAWPPRVPTQNQTFCIRYAGSLAENMALDSVIRVAEAVEMLGEAGIDAEFEINTRRLWREASAQRFRRFKRTRFTRGRLSAAQYVEWLRDADVVLIAYNFDPASVAYVQYSVANKLPECLASGAVLLAHGPANIATIKRLDELDCGVRVRTPEARAIFDALKPLAFAPDRRREIADRCRAAAFAHFNIHAVRRRFRAMAIEAARETGMRDAGRPRTRRAHLDETAVVARLLAGAPSNSVMIDVGAHVGSALAPFHDMGWRIYAFEPDPRNRRRLKEAFGESKRVRIDPRAVSDKAEEGAAFFSSEESSGISGLHAFRDTHRQSARVTVTTIADVIEARDLTAIEFLKIDVEGFDFSVLKGVPWDKVRPAVIECEFEDAKTIPLGHTHLDIAQFLEERGYTLYFSEWHPIIRYGVKHHWRRVVRWPDARMPEGAWGNILAFLNDPGADVVNAAFEAEVSESPLAPAIPAPPSPPKAHHGAPGGPEGVTDSIAELLQEHSPTLYRRLRMPMQAARAAWRRKGTLTPAALLLGLWFAAGFLPAFAPYRPEMWGAGALAVALGATAYLFLHTRRLIQVLAAENAKLRRALADSDKRIKSLEVEMTDLKECVEDGFARTIDAEPFKPNVEPEYRRYLS